MATPTRIQTEAIKITWIGAIVDAILGILKIVGGLATSSSALVADGIHSLSDLLTDTMVVVMLKLSQQPPDSDHPWGHGRIETLGTTLLGGTLIAVAGGMVWNSTLTLMSPELPTIPGWQGLLIALLSIIAKEGIYQYTVAVGRRLKSDLLIANAWHSRTDALSSVVVLIGIGGSLLGFSWLDSLAALVVALMVAHIGWQLSWNSIKQLIDTAPPAEEMAPVIEAVSHLEGIHDVHDVKARYIGSAQAIEMHLLIDPMCTASEGHFIALRAHKYLREHSEARQVIIHIDTEDDRNGPATTTLPGRRAIEQQLDIWLEKAQLRRLRLDLYYQKDKVALELCLDWHQRGQTPPELHIRSLRAHLQSPDWLDRIRISYGVDG